MVFARDAQDFVFRFLFGSLLLALVASRVFHRLVSFGSAGDGKGEDQISLCKDEKTVQL